MTRGGLGQPLQGVCGQRVSRLAMHSYPERLIFRVEMVRPAATHFGAKWVKPQCQPPERE